MSSGSAVPGSVFSLPPSGDLLVRKYEVFRESDRELGAFQAMASSERPPEEQRALVSGGREAGPFITLVARRQVDPDLMWSCRTLLVHLEQRYTCSGHLQPGMKPVVSPDRSLTGDI